MGAAQQRKLYVRNFDRYQHYKDRRPPWVKLHRSFLDDPHLAELPAGTRFVALGMILLASESAESGSSRRVEGSEKELSRRLAVTPRDLRSSVNMLLNVGFLASSPLSGRKQNLRLEVEREIEIDPLYPPHTSANGLVCSIAGCGIAFKTAQRLRDHLRNVHWREVA